MQFHIKSCIKFPCQIKRIEIRKDAVAYDLTKLDRVKIEANHPKILPVELKVSFGIICSVLSSVHTALRQ